MGSQNLSLLALTALCLGHFGDVFIGQLSSDKQTTTMAGKCRHRPPMNATKYRFQYNAQIPGYERMRVTAFCWASAFFLLIMANAVGNFKM
jgi:hypothetical protein